MHVEIPASASRTGTWHSAPDNRDTCSGLEILLPNDQWRPYIERYYQPNDLEPTYYTVTSCGHTQIECVGLDHTQYLESMTIAEKRIGKQRRSVAVYPDCEPGITKVAWMVIEP